MISQQDFMQTSLLHFENGVPIVDLHLSPQQKERLARVSHVYWQWVKNPYISYKDLLRQLVKGKFADAPAETHAAQKDVALFNFIIEHVSPPSRAVQTAKVRAAADKMLRIGMETDDIMALDKGSKRLMEIDRLNQPESQQAELSKVAFLPPVVTTSAHEVDETKEDLNDRQTLAIMNKYNAHIDEKRKSVEDKVELMLAARGTEVEADMAEEIKEE